MNEMFAQKLRWWLVSVMTLLLGTVSASIAALLGPRCTTSDSWHCVGTSLEAMGVFPFLFLVLAIWHLCDLFQHRKPSVWLISLLSGYPALIGALSLLLVLITLNATGRFTVTGSCGGIFMILSQACSFPEPWLGRPIAALLLLLPLLILAKGIFVIHSRLPKKS